MVSDDADPLLQQHLLFFVCGIQGNPEPFVPVAALLERLKGGKVIVHICRSTSGNTKDGIEAGGTRIADEIRGHVELLRKDGPLRSISFWGHSLGGIYLRYALSLLQGPEEGTICGYQPQLFIT